jgi:flagellar hook-basal body complex protein FliE
VTLPIAGVTGLSGVSTAALSQLQGGAGLQSLSSLAATDPTSGTGAAEAAGAVREADFSNVLGDGLRSLEQLDQTAQVKGVEAATGDLTDVHDYVIAANEVQLATQLTTTIRNKALDAFNEIMRMPL